MPAPAAAPAEVRAVEGRATGKQGPGLYLAAVWAAEVWASEKQGPGLYLPAAA